MERVGIYVRVSTNEQAEDGYSIGEQTDKLKKYADIKGWQVYNVYTDAGFSGSNLHRPGMQQLIEDCQDHLISTVLVYKLDRLSRSQRDTLALIEDTFNANDVAFLSLNENFDTSTPFGKAMIGILSVFAQLEREQIKERMSMGKVGRAKSGLYLGYGNAAFGYDYHDNQLHVNELQAAVVRQIFDEYEAGASTTKLRDRLNDAGHLGKDRDWSYRTVRHVLENPTYMGDVRYRGKLYPGKQTALVTKEQFDHVQQQISERQDKAYKQNNNPRPFQAKYMLSGLLRCGYCGATFAIAKSHTKNGPVWRYVCNSHGKRKTHGMETQRKTENCPARFYYKVDLEDAVTNQLIQLAIDPSKIKTKSGSKSDNSVALRNRLSELKKQSDRLVELFTTGVFDAETIKAKQEKIVSEQQSIRKQLHNIKGDTSMSTNEVNQHLQEFMAAVDEGSYDRKKSVIHMLINRITLKDDDIKIEWNF